MPGIVKSETNSHFSGYRNTGLETSFKKDNNKEQLSLGQGSRKTQFIVIFSSPPYIKVAFPSFKYFYLYQKFTGGSLEILIKLITRYSSLTCVDIKMSPFCYLFLSFNLTSIFPKLILQVHCLIDDFLNFLSEYPPISCHKITSSICALFIDLISSGILHTPK